MLGGGGGDCLWLRAANDDEPVFNSGGCIFPTPYKAGAARSLNANMQAYLAAGNEFADLALPRVASLSSRTAKSRSANFVFRREEEVACWRHKSRRPATYLVCYY